jgi:hypothetical protein
MTGVMVQVGINVQQTSVGGQSFDKLKLVGHQTASPEVTGPNAGHPV